jgi:hypothetical protein
MAWTFVTPELLRRCAPAAAGRPLSRAMTPKLEAIIRGVF